MQIDVQNKIRERKLTRTGRHRDAATINLAPRPGIVGVYGNFIFE